MKTGVCLGCKRTRPLVKRSRCAACAPGHAQRRAVVRRVREPWRKLYATRAWRAVRSLVLARDGHQCRVVAHGERCPVTSGLDVHHDPPLEELWNRAAGDWSSFLEAATDQRRLVTVCPSHNRRLDALARAAKAEAVF